MNGFSRRVLAYLSITLLVFVIAVVLGTTLDVGPGWAAVLLTGLIVVMVGHDARSRGLTVLWGPFALTLIGLVMYVLAVRRQGPPLRPS